MNWTELQLAEIEHCKKVKEALRASFTPEMEELIDELNAEKFECKPTKLIIENGKIE